MLCNGWSDTFVPSSLFRNICSFNGCLLFMQSCKDVAFVLLAEFRLYCFFLQFCVIVTHTPDPDAADLFIKMYSNIINLYCLQSK